MTNNFNLNGTVDDLFEMYEELGFEPELMPYSSRVICRETETTVDALVAGTYTIGVDPEWNKGLHVFEGQNLDGTDFALNVQETTNKPIRMDADLAVERLFDTGLKKNIDFLHAIRLALVDIQERRPGKTPDSITRHVVYRLTVGHYRTVQATRYAMTPKPSGEDREQGAKASDRFAIKVHDLGCLTNMKKI